MHLSDSTFKMSLYQLKGPTITEQTQLTFEGEINLQLEPCYLASFYFFLVNKILLMFIRIIRHTYMEL